MERQAVRGGATWGRAVTRQWERRRDDPARTGGGFGTEVPKHRTRAGGARWMVGMVVGGTC